MEEKEEKKPFEEQDENTYIYNGVKQLPVLDEDYKLTNQVSDIEVIIRENKDFETAVAVDLKGNIVVDKSGEHTQVDFTNEELSKLKNCILTHNHPLGWGYEEKDIRRIGNSFSINDLLLAVDCNVMEIRAVTPNYTFSMKRPSNGWGISVKEIESIYNRERKILYKELFIDGIYTLTDAQKETVALHILWKKISKEFGWEYRKLKTK